MKFNEHSKLKGAHALLSPSVYHWLRYDEEKLRRTMISAKAAEMGTRMHAFAAEAISLEMRLPKTRQTVNMFVNDAIKYNMEPELVLYYSPWCFGTTDALGFERNFLRIHDLKTGVTKASMDQLLIYGGLFLLEYDISPRSIDGEFRIYQNDKILGHRYDPEEMEDITHRIVWANDILEAMEKERAEV